jgi:ABC-type phosphate transport system auxiliary subunit
MRDLSETLWKLRDEIAALRKERKRLLMDQHLDDNDEDVVEIETEIEKLSEEHDRVWAALEAYRHPDR